jgi:hypothetical protein
VGAAELIGALSLATDLGDSRLEESEELCALGVVLKDDPTEVGMGSHIGTGHRRPGGVESGARRRRYVGSRRSNEAAPPLSQSWRGFVWGQTPGRLPLE